MSTKGRGIRLSGLSDLVSMSSRVCILSVDFDSMSSVGAFAVCILEQNIVPYGKACAGPGVIVKP